MYTQNQQSQHNGGMCSGEMGVFLFFTPLYTADYQSAKKNASANTLVHRYSTALSSVHSRYITHSNVRYIQVPYQRSNGTRDRLSKHHHTVQTERRKLRSLLQHLTTVTIKLHSG